MTQSNRRTGRKKEEKYNMHLHIKTLLSERMHKNVRKNTLKYNVGQSIKEDETTLKPVKHLLKV